MYLVVTIDGEPVGRPCRARSLDEALAQVFSSRALWEYAGDRIRFWWERREVRARVLWKFTGDYHLEIGSARWAWREPDPGWFYCLGETLPNRKENSSFLEPDLKGLELALSK